MANVVTVSGSKIKANSNTLTVLNQHKIIGSYAKELSAHGCGPCCTAFALTLLGKKTAPADIYKKAVSLWGKPKTYLISAKGLAAIIRKYGCKATFYKITSANLEKRKETIRTALKAGKPVICWTNSNGKTGDPFAAGHHYVLAVGYNADNKIVVANSGNKGPVNLVSLATLCKFLQTGNGKDTKWYSSVSGSAGIVVVE